jgi:hypothetical protein
MTDDPFVDEGKYEDVLGTRTGTRLVQVQASKKYVIPENKND